jgi:hypothetical protein
LLFIYFVENCNNVLSRAGLAGNAKARKHGLFVFLQCRCVTLPYWRRRQHDGIGENLFLRSEFREKPDVGAYAMMEAGLFELLVRAVHLVIIQPKAHQQ